MERVHQSSKQTCQKKLFGFHLKIPHNISNIHQWPRFCRLSRSCLQSRKSNPRDHPHPLRKLLPLPKTPPLRKSKKQNHHHLHPNRRYHHYYQPKIKSVKICLIFVICVLSLPFANLQICLVHQ